MLLPENIKNLTRTDFNTAFTSRHISFTNKKRLEVNKTMMEKAVKANKKIKKVLELSKLSYDPNSQDVYLLSGMPIIARKNSKDLDIFNNETFMIKEIRHTKSIIIIEDEDQKKIEINFEDFQYLFYVAYCITVYKSQGQSFNHPYSIHEWDRYDHRMKYVALSRATTKDCINIV
jgi:ATP-dependent exoDNAse (exonuclease V) alpha subunit